LATASGNVGIGTTSAEGVLTIKGTSAQPPTSGTTANSLLQLVGSLGAELNIGSNTVTGGYGSYIQASDNNLAVPYPLNLQPNGGSVGIGNSNGTVGTLNVTGRIALTTGLFFSSNLTSEDRWEINGGNSTDLIFVRSSVGERMRIFSNGNVAIGTSTDNGYKLNVNGNGYFGNGLTVEGTAAATTLSVSSAVYTYNVTQAYYGQTFTFTPPNALNSGSDNSLMRMYMVWVWGANGATEAGCKVWMIAMNGGGTSYTANEILGRDANGATSLSISRSSASQISINSNNNAFIKYVSIMQLMTYANG
jgi:hypothetical protein